MRFVGYYKQKRLRERDNTEVAIPSLYALIFLLQKSDILVWKIFCPSLNWTQRSSAVLVFLKHCHLGQVLL